MKEINLTQDKVALIDDADFDFISKLNWRAVKLANGQYQAITEKYFHRKLRKRIPMARMILKLEDGVSKVEYQDSNPLNNQKVNLRIAGSPIIPSTTKKCCTCKRIIDTSFFGRNKHNLDGLEKKCKDCRSLYHQKNSAKIYDKVRKYVSENRLRVRTYFREYAQRQRLTNPEFRLLSSLRSRINSLIRGKDKSSTTMELIGCDILFLKSHLEAKFQEGMSWNNYGKWHVDHVIPCAKFDILNPAEQRKCFHYSNLQPLWAIDNFKKGGR